VDVPPHPRDGVSPGECGARVCGTTSVQRATKLGGAAGVKEMREKSDTIGNAAFVTGLDQNAQSVPEDQRPAYLAAQCWDHDFAGRVMMTMKIMQETHGTLC
jgi:hypothetical protein